MSALNDLIEKSKNMSMEDRVAVASDATDSLIAGLKACNIDDDTITGFLVNVFKLFVSGDRKARRDEYILFKDLFKLDIDTDTFFNLTNYGSDAKFVAQFDNIVDSSPKDVAVAVVTLGILIITADGEVTSEERALLERIYNR